MQIIYKPGEKIGDCIIIKYLGSGGFCRVYKAECERYSTVAIKHYTYPDLRYDDVLDEAFSQAQFNNTGYIVKVYDARKIGNEYYLFMEYMEKGTLRDRLNKGKIPLNEAIKIIYRIAYALKLLHSEGLLHRDICPENIFFNEKNEAVLGDFGLAVFSKDPKVAKLAGHKPYIAPEVIKGAPHSEQSDIYSLGRVFYKMVVGKLPNEDEIERAIAISDNELKTLVEQGKFETTWPEDLDIPQQIKNIISRATAISPDERYKKIDEMLNELLLFLSKTPTYAATFMEIKDTIEAKDIEQGLEEIIQVIIKGGVVEEPIEKESAEKFNKLLQDKIRDVLNGFKRPFRITILNAVRRAQDYRNNYIGIEHIFLALSYQSIFAEVLRKMGQSLLEIKEKLEGYTHHNKVLVVERLFSPRLEKILNELRRKYPEGIGEKEFIISALKEESMVNFLLQEKGINIEKFIAEVKNYEV